MSQYTAFIERSKSISNVEQIKLCIGIDPLVCCHKINKIILDFSIAFPLVELKIVQQNSESLAQKLTDKTFVDADELMEELDKISKQGYSVDDEEFMDGMRAIAVPVTDNNGRFVAALAFHGPSQRLSVEYLIEQRDVLFNGAQTIKQGVLS